MHETLKMLIEAKEEIEALYRLLDVDYRNTETWIKINNHIEKLKP